MIAISQDSSSDSVMTANSETMNSPVASGLSPIGPKATIPITVAPSSGTCVFCAASSAASRECSPRRMAVCIPSATTIALSTSMPIAMISAPRLMRSISTPKGSISASVPVTVSNSVPPTTTAARSPMNSAKTTRTMATDMPRLTRKSFEAACTITCC